MAVTRPFLILRLTTPINPMRSMQFTEYLTRAEYLKGVVGQDSGNGPAESGAAAAQKVRKAGTGKEEVRGKHGTCVCGHASNTMSILRPYTTLLSTG